MSNISKLIAHMIRKEREQRRAGGGGRCKYCNTYQNNVSFHEVHTCEKRPNKPEAK